MSVIQPAALYGAGGAVVFIILLTLFIKRRRTPKLNPVKYTDRWKELQRNCATRKTWPMAIIEADNLLDDALKHSHYKGKTTGERLVAAQHRLSDNEAVWFGHKLRNRIVHEDVRKLKKQEIFDALGGFRQALRDLGALPKEVPAKPEEAKNA